MVTDTDTVIEPWAVMVESFNTAIADGTMPRTGRPKDKTLRAEV